MGNRQEPMTEDQLRRGAGSICYRAGQVTDSFKVWKIGLPDETDYRIRGPIENALVESTLIHARSLAFFLQPQLDGGDVHFSDYRPDWSDPIIEAAQGIIDPVSRYLAHSSRGSQTEEPHPRAWPIPEMAVALVGGLASLTADLSVAQRAWFWPEPGRLLGEMKVMGPLPGTERSDNPKVAELTDSLHAYLRGRGLMAPDEDEEE